MANNLDEYQEVGFYRRHGEAKENGFSSFEYGGQYYFCLYVGGKIALISQAYKGKSGRDNGIRSVIKNSKIEERFRYGVRNDGKQGFSLIAGNSQEIAVSAGYASEGAARNFVKTMRSGSSSWSRGWGSSSSSSKSKSTRSSKTRKSTARVTNGSGRAKTAAAAVGVAGLASAARKSLDGDYRPLAFYKKQTKGKKKGFEKFLGTDGLYYFTYSENGKIALISEGYRTAAGRDNGVDSVKKNIKIEKRYRFRKLKNGKYDYVLRAGNNIEIARSVWYGSATGAAAGAAYLAGTRRRPAKKTKTKTATTTATTVKKRTRIAVKPVSKTKTRRRTATAAKIVSGTAAAASLSKAAAAKPKPSKPLKTRMVKKETVVKTPPKPRPKPKPKPKPKAKVKPIAAAVPAAAAAAVAASKVVKPVGKTTIHKMNKKVVKAAPVVAPKPAPVIAKAAPVVAAAATAPVAAKVAAPVAAGTAAASGGFKFPWWLLLIPLLGVLFFGLKKCQPAATVPAVEVPAIKVEAPVIKVPEVKVPEVKVPEVKVPEVKIPEVKVAEVAPVVAAPVCGVPSCGYSSNPLFNIPNRSPKSISALGSNPEFGNSHGLTATQFQSKLSGKYFENTYDRNYLNAVAKSIGYSSFEDIPSSAFSETTLAYGTKGLLGFGEHHGIQYSKLNVRSDEDLKAFRIEGADGCQHVNFMKTCGNYMYVCE